MCPRLFPLLLLLLAAACGPARLPYDDDFSGRGGWTVGAGANGEVSLTDGQYVLRAGTADWLVWGVSERLRDLEGVHVEVTASDHSPTAGAGFGIVCHYQDADNFHYLGVSSDGYYVIGRIAAGEERVLLEDRAWQDALGLVPPAAGTYRLGADCEPDRLTLYADGDTVDIVVDQSLGAGQVGLFVASADRPQAEVRFDEFAATALDASPAGQETP